MRQFLRDLRAYPQLTSLTVSSLALPADSQQVTAQLSIRLYYSDQPPLEPLDDEPFPPYDYLSPLGQDVVDPDTSLAPPPTPTADEPTDDPSAEPDEVETVGPSPAPGP